MIGCFHAFAVGSISGKRLGQGLCFQPCPCWVPNITMWGKNEMDLCVACVQNDASRHCKVMKERDVTVSRLRSSKKSEEITWEVHQ